MIRIAMTRQAQAAVRFELTGWRRLTFRTVRVAYTASKFGLAMMAPAHALPNCVTAPFTVDCKTAPTQAPEPAVWLP